MKRQDGPRAEEAIAVIHRLRPLMAELPDVVERIDDFGHLSFRIRDRPFVLVGEGTGRGSLAIKSDSDTQRFLVEHRCFERAPYIGRHGWVVAKGLPPNDWDEIEKLVRDGYRLAAKLASRRRTG